MLVADIKPLHCQRIVNMQAGKSKTQINEVYNALRFFFRYAVANEIIVKDPTSHLNEASWNAREKTSPDSKGTAGIYRNRQNRPKILFLSFDDLLRLPTI